MPSTPAVKQQRGEPLVAKILTTTLREIARVGYQNLSIEAVAARAGVNKTTIYRRWPTLEKLTLCAFASSSDKSRMPDTGALRGDLIGYLKRYRKVCRSPASLSLLRMHLGGDGAGKLGVLIRQRSEQGDHDMLQMFCRAVTRGELPSHTDLALLRDLVVGSVQHLFLFRPEPCSDAKLARVVDLILRGAVHGGRAPRTRRPPAKPATPSRAATRGR